MTVNRQAMLAIADDGFSTSTDLAESLFQQTGLPFDQAHHSVAELTQVAIKEGKTLSTLDINHHLSKHLKNPVSIEMPSVQQSIQSKNNIGSPGKLSISQAIASMQAHIDQSQHNHT